MEPADGRCDFYLVLLSCRQTWKLGGLGGDARESLSEVVEGGFPCINTQGYIIVLKLNI